MNNPGNHDAPFPPPRIRGKDSPPVRGDEAEKGVVKQVIWTLHYLNQWGCFWPPLIMGIWVDNEKKILSTLWKLEVLQKESTFLAIFGGGGQLLVLIYSRNSVRK